MDVHHFAPAEFLAAVIRNQPELFKGFAPNKDSGKDRKFNVICVWEYLLPWPYLSITDFARETIRQHKTSRIAPPSLTVALEWLQWTKGLPQSTDLNDPRGTDRIRKSYVLTGSVRIGLSDDCPLGSVAQFAFVRRVSRRTNPYERECRDFGELTIVCDCGSIRSAMAAYR